jgi:hypothetical protein
MACGYCRAGTARFYPSMKPGITFVAYESPRSGKPLSMAGTRMGVIVL